MNIRPLVRAFFFSVLIALQMGIFAAANAATNPVPYVTQSLVPTAVAPGSSGFALTVDGTGFVSGSVIQWNGSARVTSFVSSSQLTATILASDIATTSTATVTVTSPAPGGGTSNPVFFQVANATSSVTYNPVGISAGAVPQNSARQVVEADFNGDGKLDLATTNGDNTISVLIGNGAGNFLAPVIYPAGPSGSTLQGLTIGDFNGDGKIDLAVSLGPATPGIAVLLGNGDGTFQSPIITSVLSPVPLLVAADVNGDGKLDLLTNCNLSVCAYLGNGDGTFTVAGGSGAFSGAVTSLAVGDFNGDGLLDVAATATSGGTPFLAVALGNGDGTFGTPTTIATASGALSSSVAVADLNQDGILDLAYYSQACSFSSCTGTLQVWLGNGDGTFLSLPSVTGLPGASTGIPVIGDFNGDGILDIGVLTAVLLGRGDGTFTLNPASLSQNIAAAGDFNGDGVLDLLAPVGAGVYVQLELPGDFTGGITPTSQSVIAGASANYEVSVVPVNGFLGTVTLSVTGLPSGVTPSFQSSTIARSSGTTTLNLATTPLAAPGTYVITLTGTSGTLTHSTQLTLLVTPATPDFSGTVTPTSQVIGQGQMATYSILVESLNGFTGTVTPSVTGLPAGATASLSPAVVTGGQGPTVLTILTAGNTPIGEYFLTLTGTSGSLTHSSNLILNVIAQADFTGSVGPLTASVSAGQLTVYTINVVPLNGFTGTVVLGVSGLPSGATAKISPAKILGGSGSASLQITTTTATPLGSYLLTVSGTSGTLSHSTTVTLNVNASPGDFTGSITPSSQSIPSGESASYGINLSPVGGFTGNVTLTVSGLPVGATASFNPGNLISGGSGSTTVTVSTTSGTTIPGTYSFVITAASGGITHSESIALIVN